MREPVVALPCDLAATVLSQARIVRGCRLPQLCTHSENSIPSLLGSILRQPEWSQDYPPNSFSRALRPAQVPPSRHRDGPRQAHLLRASPPRRAEGHDLQALADPWLLPRWRLQGHRRLELPVHRRQQPLALPQVMLSWLIPQWHY